MITLAELERALDRGEQWGFRKETNDQDFLGWILISKRHPPILWPSDEKEHPIRYQRIKAERERLLKTPYHVKILELSRTVHESGDYENAADYRLIENLYFSTIHDVTAFVQSLGYELSHILPRREIDAP